MELAFTIVAGLSILLIIIGYLGFVIAGFKHHFVTGLISTLPVLNIVTVPALWPKASRKVIMSLLGLILLTASWFLGANTGISKYVGILKGNEKTTHAIVATAHSSAAEDDFINANLPHSSRTSNKSITTNSISNSLANIDEGKLQQLPMKALYRLHFEVVPVDDIQSLKNRVVKVITTKDKKLEGRITSMSLSSIVIQNNELPIANIKQISLMVKKVN